MHFEAKLYIRKIDGAWRIIMTRRLGGGELSPLAARCRTWVDVPQAANDLWAHPLGFGQ